jgi:hypothetical protein
MQQQRDRVGVVIPVYRAHFLADCLASVFAQTRPPDRVAVVDDGSPEGALIETLVRRYGDRLTLIREENRGAGAARNRGIQALDTDLIGFIDADDEWLPQFLERQLALLHSGDWDAVYANGDIVGDSPLRGMRFMDTAPSEGPVSVEALLSQRCTVLTSSVVVRRQALVDVGLFDEDLRRGQDFDMWVRLAARGVKFTYSTRPLVKRRIHSQNLSGDSVSELERAAAVLSKVRGKLALAPAQLQILDRRAQALRAQLATEQGKKTLLAGDVAEARTHFREAVAAGGGWKPRIASLALQLAPAITRQAYLFKLRRGAAPTPIQPA